MADSRPLPPPHWVDHTVPPYGPPASGQPGSARPSGFTREPPNIGWVKDALALAEAIFDSDAGPPSPDELAWLGHELVDYVDKIGSRSRFVILTSIRLIAGFVPVAALRPLPLRRLPLQSRVRALAKLEKTPLAMNLLAVKGALAILWFEHPRPAMLAGLR